MALSKKKVVSVEPALNQRGERETWKHQQSGKVYYSTLIKFEDGKVGTYSHEGLTQDYFVAGQEVEFEAKNMGTWWKLMKPKKKWDKHPGGWVPKSPAEIKRDNIGFAAGYVKDLIVAGTIKLEQFGETLAQFMTAISDEVDKIKDD